MGSICLARLVQEGVNIVGVVAPPPDAPTFYQFCDLVKYFKLNLITYRNSLKDADFLEKIKSLMQMLQLFVHIQNYFRKSFWQQCQTDLLMFIRLFFQNTEAQTLIRTLLSTKKKKPE